MNNRIEAEMSYLVPETEGAFRIAGPAGHEVVYWTITPAKVGEPDPLPPPPPPGKPERAARLEPRCDEAILRARGDCVDHSAGIQTTREQARGLVFLKDEDQASVVAAPPELTGPVTFEFRLAHR